MMRMVDCRSLIEFCKTLEHHHHTHHHHRITKNKNNALNPIPPTLSSSHHPSFCKHHSPFAAVDVFILILVIGSLAFLTLPYLALLFRHASLLLPPLFHSLQLAILTAPVAYLIGLVVAFTGVITVVVAWEILDFNSRKCGNPRCKGMRKPVEFDIQLEPEECVKYLPAAAHHNTNNNYNDNVKALELGDDHKELEAELKRMAPLNGRTVLIFRSPCGCPAGRLEVWGNKKIRRIKK